MNLDEQIFKKIDKQMLNQLMNENVNLSKINHNQYIQQSIIRSKDL
jgi:hypothetical protein